MQRIGILTLPSDCNLGKCAPPFRASLELLSSTPSGFARVPQAPLTAPSLSQPLSDPPRSISAPLRSFRISLSAPLRSSQSRALSAPLTLWDDRQGKSQEWNSVLYGMNNVDSKQPDLKPQGFRSGSPALGLDLGPWALTLGLGPWHATYSKLQAFRSGGSRLQFSCLQLYYLPILTRTSRFRKRRLRNA